MNKPLEISRREWEEIVQIPCIRDSFGLDDTSTVEHFQSMAYGVKFFYVTAGTGYFGDLFVLQDDALNPPIVLIRKKKNLVVFSQPTD